MLWKENKWRYLIVFFIGVLICYISTQFIFFEIDYAINVPETIMAVLGLGVGLFIASTIQKNITRNQNRYSLLESKLDDSWTKFIKLSKLISIDDKIPLESLSSYNEDIVHQISFLKNIFGGFEMDCTCIEILESKLEEFENTFDCLKTEDNIKYYKEEKNIIEEKIVIVNQCFSKVLNTIQKI
jgi:hypothetical protein